MGHFDDAGSATGALERGRDYRRRLIGLAVVGRREPSSRKAYHLSTKPIGARRFCVGVRPPSHSLPPRATGCRSPCTSIAPQTGGHGSSVDRRHRRGGDFHSRTGRPLAFVFARRLISARRDCDRDVLSRLAIFADRVDRLSVFRRRFLFAVVFRFSCGRIKERRGTFKAEGRANWPRWFRSRFGAPARVVKKRSPARKIRGREERAWTGRKNAWQA